MIYSTLSYNQFQELAPYLDTVILPIGSIQAHGPHLPLATDNFIATRIAMEVDNFMRGRVLLLPEIPYGHTADSQLVGTLQMPTELLASYVYQIVKQFRKFGAKYLVLINTNGGNLPALSMAGDQLVEEGFSVLVSNWWIDYRAQIAAIAKGAGHAGEDETSLMMQIAPETVTAEGVLDRTGHLFTKVRYPGLFDEMYPEGYSGSPAQATAEKGEEILSLIKEKLLHEIQEMWRMSTK